MNNQLDEIHTLERKLIDLKHKYIEGTASIDGGTAAKGDTTFLLISIAGKIFAFPLGYVSEVIQMTAVSILPERVKGVAGLIDYHGNAMAVVDLRDIMEGGRSRISVDKLMVICSTNLIDFAVIVDEATDVITVAKEDVQVPEEVLPGALKALGVVKTPEGNAHIVDVMSIVFSIQRDESAQDEANAGLDRFGSQG